MPSVKPRFFTPGPLSMSDSVLAAMGRDWGSRDADFVDLTAALLGGLKSLFGAGGDHALVPLQGSGTFAIEAMVGSIVPPGGKLLIFENGIYAARMANIATALGRSCRVVQSSYLESLRPAAVAQILADDPAVTHVGIVHLETGTGLLNPVQDIARAVQQAGRKLLVDAMATVGAFDLGVTAVPCEAIAFSSNKCLQGPPGLGFVLARTKALNEANSPSTVLDLYQQWQHLQRGGQWRFTPPTHVVAGTHAAMLELQVEGGAAARLARYADNADALHAACTGQLGLEPVLAPQFRSPIIQAFTAPLHPAFCFDALYQFLKRRNLYIYPGTLTGSATFRIGCIGDIHRIDMTNLAAALGAYWDHAKLR